MSGERRWPETLCSADPNRPFLHRPARVGSHLLYSDGLVAVEIADDGRDAQEPWTEGLVSFLDDYTRDERPDPASFDATALIEFCGPAEGDCPHCTAEQRAKVCGECGGTGEVECECWDCGDEHMAECEACGGEGGAACLVCNNEGHIDRYTRDRMASFQGVWFNPRLLAAILDGAPGRSVTIARQGNAEMPLVIRGDGWRAVLMPVRASDTDLHVEPIDHLALESAR